MLHIYFFFLEVVFNIDYITLAKRQLTQNALKQFHAITTLDIMRVYSKLLN